MNTMPKLKIEMLPVDALNEYEGNARQHGETDIAAIKASIEKFGFNDPIGIWGENIIVEGHGRLMAAKDLGMTEVPVIRLDHLTEEERRAYGLAHNKTAELSMWNFEKLDLELAGIKSFDMTQYGFPEIEQEPDPEDIIEDTPPEDAPSICERGQIYKLGEHRLMCGDSTSTEDMDALMAGETAVLLLTDPPYNVSLGQNGGHPLIPSEAKQLHRRTDGLIIANDAWKNDEDFIEFLHKAFTVALEKMCPGGVFYIWYGDTQALNFRLACQRSGMTIRENLIWVKNSFAFGRQDYQWQHEPCLYGWKDGAAHYFIKKRTLTTVIEDQVDLDKMKKEDMKKLLEVFLSEEMPTTIMRAPKPTFNDLHPTMKPVKLVARLMFNSSRKGDIVADIFGGSGTTMIAAEQLGRRCMMMELDPHYCDVIIARWEAFTGQKAERIA